MSKYQVAIIGTNIGAKHYEDFQKVSDKFNVHTVCGLTKESIENLLPANSDTKISLNFEKPNPYRYWNTGKISLPVSLLIFSSSSISLRLETNGFSQITCLPDSKDFLQAEKCK